MWEKPFNDTLKPQSNGSLFSNTVIGTLAVDGWHRKLLHLVHRGGAWTGRGPAQAPPRCTKCKAHPSTASVPTSYYLMWHYNCPGLERVKRAQSSACYQASARKCGGLRDGDVHLFVCSSVCLLACRLWNLLSYSLDGSTWQWVGAYRIWHAC